MALHETILVLIALATANAEFYDFDGNLIGDDIQPPNTNTSSQPAAQHSGEASQEPSIMGLITGTVGVNVAPGVDPLEAFRDSYPLPRGFSEPLDVYDYIIVGAGTAGSVLASRLTEDPKTMVLVLEAGLPELMLSEIPLLTAQWPVSDYAWHHTAEPQPGICTGSEGDVCYWPHGKAVGGSSVINFMMYTRGRPAEWDRIAADGNDGWSYNDVLKYYKKCEKADLKLLPKNHPGHGRNGPVNVEHMSLRTGLVEAFLEAGRINGYPTVDYNTADELGFGYVQTTTHKGHRVSASKAYLHPHKCRPNLHILPASTVTKVNIDPKCKRAYGVNYTRNEINYEVRCRKEVILSAGPLGSPQLLMLSGVGPKKHLKSLGIPVIKDLPVGKTMYDHITFPGIAFKINATNAGMLLQDAVTPNNLLQWIFYGEGIMSSIGAIEGVGYVRTSESDDLQVPDIELISLAGSLALDSGAFLRKAWKIKDSTYNEGFSPLNGLDTWMSVPMLLHPKSKGYLELKDTNPFSQPKLVANYFSDPKDLATMKAAVKFIIKLGESKAFKKYGMSLYLPKYEQCKTEVPGSDGYWECAIKTMVLSLHHQIATCRMGPASDPLAVVDPELKVYGIKCLRVVDTGVIPRTTSAHNNAPAMMIGEKAADMIKQSFGC